MTHAGQSARADGRTGDATFGRGLPSSAPDGTQGGDGPPRCLMVSCGSVLVVDGYTIRVWMALRAVAEVQRPAGARPVLLAFESVRNLRSRDKTTAARAQATALGCELWLVPSLPKSMPWQFTLNRLWGALAVRYVMWRTGAKIAHAQNHVAAAAVATALARRPAVRMVFDVHGVDVEERMSDGRLRSAAEGDERLEAQAAAAARADDLIVVSTAMGEYLRSAALERGRECRGRLHLVPCVSSLPSSAVDTVHARAEARARMELGAAPCLLYLGSASAWQQPRLTIEVFVALRARVPAARLLIITGEPAVFAEIARELHLDPESLVIRSVPHHEVPGVAAAADVALLLREDTIVNRVSSPTKFAEYLSLGIPVVVTEVLSDFADIVRSADVGTVVAADAPPAAIAAAVEELLATDQATASARRQRCVEAVQRHLSFESVLPAYDAIYGLRPRHERVRAP